VAGIKSTFTDDNLMTKVARGGEGSDQIKETGKFRSSKKARVSAIGGGEVGGGSTTSAPAQKLN